MDKGSDCSNGICIIHFEGKEGQIKYLTQQTLLYSTNITRVILTHFHPTKAVPVTIAMMKIRPFLCSP